jgi:hypothetical protein
MVGNNYYSEITQFMSFMDGIEYPRNDNLAARERRDSRRGGRNSAAPVTHF